MDISDDDHGDASLAALRRRKRGGRKHKGPFRRILAVPDLILEFQAEDLRENALRSLSGMLNDKRDDDQFLYAMTGVFLCYSFGTLPILLQEIVSVYPKFAAEYRTQPGDTWRVRQRSDVAFVFVLHNPRPPLVDTACFLMVANIGSYILPLILSKEDAHNEIYENLRLMSLSVIAALCEGMEEIVSRWVLEAKVFGVCLHAAHLGSELSKVMSTTIIERALQHDDIRKALTKPDMRGILDGTLITFCKMVNDICTSPGPVGIHLLDLVLQCCILLFTYIRSRGPLRLKVMHTLRDSLLNELLRPYSDTRSKRVHVMMLLNDIGPIVGASRDSRKPLTALNTNTRSQLEKISK
ncbi:hypothetical protein CLOP_g15404 [Closterium sp. NIES-67]|nr:hypothetical protein CLOP_g15404 [Closterium sp. NIES-67]